MGFGHTRCSIHSATSLYQKTRTDNDEALTLCSQQHGIRIITMNNERKRNAMSLAMLDSLKTDLEIEDGSELLRAIIIRGKGPVFSAGHDLSEMTSKRGMKHHMEIFKKCSEVMNLVQDLPVPVIAEVDGVATAAGCQLVASCDIAIVSENSINALCEKLWSFQLESSPEFRTYIGVEAHTDEPDDYSLASYEKRREFCMDMLKEAKSIDIPASLDSTSRINLHTIETYMTTCISGLQYEAHLMPFNFYEGIDTAFNIYVIPRMHFDTRRDFDVYLRRLAKFPLQVDQAIELMRCGINKGIVPHPISVQPFLTERIHKGATCNPEEHAFFKPIRTMNEAISPTDREEIIQSATNLLRSAIQPAYSKLFAFLNEIYVPSLRSTLSVDSIPGASGRYKALLKYHCDVDWSPDTIHNIGLQEVTKLQRRLTKVMAKVGFSGTVKEFAEFVRNQPHLHFTTEDEIIPYCENIIENTIKPKLKHFFTDIPDLPLSLLSDPGKKQVAKAFYTSPLPDGSKPGILWVSTKNPQTFGKYELVCLMLHETDPGHHFQACSVHGNDKLPKFRQVKDDRRYYEMPGRFPNNTAYTEGWGLYCEALGDEMGLYEDPYTEYGYLGYNLSRSARMVVDTGIHALGWSKQQGVDFLECNTVLSSESIQSEVDRYITWPGQASSYKIGHMKLEELRGRAEKTLGDDFDIKEFHRCCLENGQVPLSTLEELVDDYISQMSK